MMFGVPSKGAMINLDMSKVYSKEITLVTSYAASDTDTKDALELIESSQIDVKQLITHTYSITDSQKAFDHALIFYGDHAEIVRKYKELVERPQIHRNYRAIN